MAKTKSHKLPDTIYVVQRETDGQPLLLADDEYEGFDDGEIVGVYARTEVVTKHVRHSVTPVE